MFKHWIKRYRMWRAYRRMAKAWREAGGGSVRYRYALGGGYMAFSGPECETASQLAAVMREVAEVLEAVERGEFDHVEVGDSERFALTDKGRELLKGRE